MLSTVFRLAKRQGVFALLIISSFALASQNSSRSSVRGVVSSDVVISQVYGAGGNSGASFQNDFIELFNRGNSPVNVTGWAVQYASSTGTTWQKTDLTGTIAAGQYLLIQQASGGANGAPLPSPDATGTIAMAATAGKVVLTNNNILIASGTSCPSGANVVDLVGYGSAANCFEGAGPTGNLSATAAALRVSNGCTETDNNSADFTASAPTPRNSASPIAVCGAPTNPTGIAAANPNPVTAGNVVLLTVAVTPGANPSSTGITVTANISSIGGAVSQLLFDNGTSGDVTPNDNVFSFQPLVEPTSTVGMKTIPITIADAQSRSSSTSINLTVQAPAPPGNVVISQIFGGGGNSGAPYTHDFIELFNRSGAQVNLGGWSVQYSTAAGSSWQKTDLSGTLAPGQYLLVQQASGGANGQPLPAPDITGTISMASTAGKVALVNNTTLLTLNCPLGPNVVDFVGYGSTASCFEGLGPSPAPSSANAILRVGQGCGDTNNNSANFFAGAPMPRNTASPLGDCSGGAKFDSPSVSLKITDSAVCTTAGNIVTIEAKLTNTGNRVQTDNPGSEFTAQLPANLIALSGTCTATSGNCVITGSSQIDWNGAVAIGETVTIKFNAQVAEAVTAGAQLCANSTVSFDSNNDGINDATVNSQSCLMINCPAIGPGKAFPSTAEFSDQKAGSVLVYPLYSSSSLNLSRENTRFSITNIDAARRIAVHLFFIQDDSASVADAYVCLTPNQTTSFLASDFDPDIAGYLIAIAVDERGCPINFNFLIGEEFVKLSSGHAANLPAIAFAALTGAPTACDGNSVTAEIKFDGVSYNAAPRVLAASSIPSAVDGNSTVLVIDRIGGNLGTGVSTIGQIFGLLFDDTERAYSFERNTTRRQFRSVLSNTDFPRTAPRFTSVIPAGRTGWMKFWRDSDGGIVGSIINFNPNTAASSAAFNQGRNLHAMTLTTASSFVIPVFPPGC